MTSIIAAVSRGGKDPFAIEELRLADPQPHEVLVRFTAAGLCHTDLVAAAGDLPTPLPAVLGHEGAGVVEAVGSAVRGLVPGDRVLASFSFCGHCANCLRGQPAYCPQHFPLNFGGQTDDGSVGLTDSDGLPVQDHFFGQSSFGSYGLCRPSSLYRIGDTPLGDADLAPLGCGIITGAGAVWNSLRVTPGSSVVVFGAGAVGLSAAMASVVAGAARIIVVDPHRGRLDLAQRMGATDVVVAGADSADAIRELTGGAGVDFAIESTGLPDVMADAFAVLAPLGSAAILGIAAPRAQISIDAFGLLLGRTVTGSVVGHQAPAVMIQRVLDLNAQGRFPFEWMNHSYPMASLASAVADVHSGSTIKAVLVHDHTQHN
jgi:aryl-alcohol dehydrogenase